MNLRLGVSFFALLSVLGFMVVFFLFTDASPLVEVFRRLDMLFLGLCVVVVPLVDWVVAGVRMWLFTSALCTGIPYGVCVKNCAVGSFMGAATPSQTGGGLAQVYVLVKEGANAGQAISVLFLTFLSTLVFYALASVVMWGLHATGRLPDMGASSPFALAAVLFVGMTVLGFAAVLYPLKTQAGLERFVNRFQSRKRLGPRAAMLIGHLNDWSATVQLMVRLHKMRFLLSIPITVVIFFNKYFAAYLAVRTLGLDTALVELMVIQMFLHILLYFFPTPGGSGAAEVGTAVVMQSLIPSTLLPAYTLLWRTSIMYFPVLVGGLILIRYIRRSTGSNVVEIPDDAENPSARGEPT